MMVWQKALKKNAIVGIYVRFLGCRHIHCFTIYFLFMFMPYNLKSLH